MLPAEYLGNWGMVEIKKSPGKGLGVFAKQNIPQGTCILLERALLTVPDPARNQHPDIFVWRSIAAVRALDPSQLSQLLSLADNSQFPHHVFETFAWSLGIVATPDETRALAVIETNTYGTGVFLKGSRFNHACVPNVFRWHDEGRNWAGWYARREIGVGEELTVSYVCQVETRDVRARRLEQFVLECGCPVCVGPDVEGYDKRCKLIRGMRAIVQSFLEQESGDMDDERGCNGMLKLFLLYAANCAGEPGILEDLLDAYACLANFGRKVNDAALAASACEQADMISTIIYGKQHPWTREYREAAELLRSSSVDGMDVMDLGIRILDRHIGRSLPGPEELAGPVATDSSEERLWSTQWGKELATDGLLEG